MKKYSANLFSIVCGLGLLLTTWYFFPGLLLASKYKVAYAFLIATVGGFLGILDGSKHKWIPLASLVLICLGVVTGCLAYMNSVGVLTKKEIQVPAVFFSLVVMLAAVYFIARNLEDKNN
jgi:hypothetical protein